MNPIRLLIQGQEVPGKTVFLALAVLVLFGISTNALYDFYKLAPALVAGSASPADKLSLWLDLAAPTLLALILCIYLLGRRRRNASRFPPVPRPDTVSPHKGIILALSIPTAPSPESGGSRTLKPEEVIAQIEKTPLEEVESLYAIRGIGQLFKGVYHHGRYLQYIWPLYTEYAAPYKQCIQAFIDKFMNVGGLLPQVRIRDADGCCSLSAREDRKLLDELKSRLADIYSEGNLTAIDLSPSDIIVDVTGGTKIMSIGMTFGALDSAIDIQYVEQKDYQVIPLTITPDAIMDKVSTYLMELSTKTKIAGK